MPTNAELLAQIKAETSKRPNNAELLARIKEAQPVDIGEAFGTGFLEGATLGVGGTLREYVQQQPQPGQTILGPGGRWEQAAKASAARTAKAYEQQPLAAGAGEIAGAVVPGYPLAGLKTPVQRILGQGVAGGVRGLASGSAVEGGQGAAVGAGIGAVAEGLTGGAGRAAGIVSSRLNKLAGEYAARAAGFMKATSAKLEGTRGGGQLAAKYGGVAKFGREQLINRGLVQAGDTLDSVYEKAVQLRAAGAEEMDNMLTGIDELSQALVKKLDDIPMSKNMRESYKKAAAVQFQGSANRIADRIEEEYIAPKLEGVAGAFFPGEVAEAQALVKRIREAGKPTGGVMTMGELQRLKTQFERKKAFRTAATNITLSQEMQQEVARILRTEIEDVVSKLDILDEGINRLGAVATGGKITPKGLLELSQKGMPQDEGAKELDKIASTLARFKEAKTKFQVGQITSEAAADRMAARATNRGPSLSTTIATTGGMAGGMAAGAGGIGSALQGMAIGALNELGLRYGSAITGVGLAKLADAIEKRPAIAMKLIQAAKGSGGILGAHYMLLEEDPEYSKEIGQVDKQKLIDLVIQDQAKEGNR